MTDEYGDESFVRLTDSNITTAKRSNKPKKAANTAQTHQGLLYNRSHGKLLKKIVKYNRAYNELQRLAENVNEARPMPDEESEEFDYTEVKEAIDKYNVQARRLAKLGGQILAYTDNLSKIGFASNQSARAIKVPGFLIGPLRMLTAVGREQAKKEKEMSKQIFDVAQQAVGTPEGSIDEVLLNSLKTDETDLGLTPLDQPVPDIEETQSITPPSVEEESYREETEEEKRSQVDNAIARRVQMENSPVVDESDVRTNIFNNLRNLSQNYATERFVVENHASDILLAKHDGVQTKVSPSQLGRMLNIDEDLAETYKTFVKMTKFSELWAKTFGEEMAFTPDKQEVFNFLYDNSEMDTETLLKTAQEQLSEESLADLQKIVSSDEETVKNGMEAINTCFKNENVDERTDVEVEENVDVDEAERQRQLVAKGMQKRAESKYGLRSDVPQEEENDVELENNDDVHDFESQEQPELVPEDDELEPVAPVESSTHEESDVREDDTDYVTRIRNLTHEISELNKAKSALRENGADDATIAKLNASINQRFKEINELSDTFTKTEKLDKDLDEKREEVVHEEVEPTVEVEEQSEVEEDASYDEDKEWWEKMIPTLDDPDQQLATKVNIANYERERAIERANYELEEKRFQENRDKLIAEDKQRREDRELAEKNEIAMKMLEAADLYTHEQLEEMLHDDSEMSPAQLVDKIKECAPNDYANMEEAYHQSLMDNLTDSAKSI